MEGQRCDVRPNGVVAVVGVGEIGEVDATDADSSTGERQPPRVGGAGPEGIDLDQRIALVEPYCEVRFDFDNHRVAPSRG